MSLYRLLVLYPPPADPAAFRHHYETVHQRLAARIPGLLRSGYGFEPQGLGQASPYFCLWQGDFASVEAMQAALQSPEGRAVAADMPNYATGGAVILHYAVEEGQIL